MDGTSFTTKMNPFDQARAPRESLEKDLILVSLEKEVTKAQEGLLLTLWEQLHMERV